MAAMRATEVSSSSAAGAAAGAGSTVAWLAGSGGSEGEQAIMSRLKKMIDTWERRGSICLPPGDSCLFNH